MPVFVFLISTSIFLINRRLDHINIFFSHYSFSYSKFKNNSRSGKTIGLKTFIFIHRFYLVFYSTACSSPIRIRYQHLNIYNLFNRNIFAHFSFCLLVCLHSAVQFVIVLSCIIVEWLWCPDFLLSSTKLWNLVAGNISC